MSGLAQVPVIGSNTQQKRGRGNPNWHKGMKSPNPSGRESIVEEFRSLCRTHTPEAVQALVFALGDPDHAVAAAKVLLEFGYGKAPAELRLGTSGPIVIGALSMERIEDMYRNALALADKTTEKESHE